jgi:hypothetical protein
MSCGLAYVDAGPTSLPPCFMLNLAIIAPVHQSAGS